MPFVECDRCARKRHNMTDAYVSSGWTSGVEIRPKRPGSPTLCGGCIKNRELIAFRERENERLQARLAELLPDSPKVDNGDLAIEIRQRLRQDLGKYLNGAHYIDIIVRYSGKDIRVQFDWVKELLK